MVGDDPYRIQLGHVRRARSDLRLVLANVRVLFGLVTTRPSCASDSAAESMLVITRLGASANR
jgi:hypothetical protein